MSKTPERILVASKKWKDKNKEKVSEYNKKWNAENVEIRRLLKKNWDAKNKDKNKAYDIMFRDKNPDYHIKRHLKTKYGMSLDGYTELLESQGGVCAVCGKHPDDTNRGRLFVDHDHVTGKIRGLLCQQCNTALGMVSDRVDVLTALISYLREAARSE